jgi:hypothetical protein
MTTAITPIRKTRAPRTALPTFHLSSGIAVSTSAAMLERIDAMRLLHDQAKPAARRKLSRSKLIRTALTHYAHRVQRTKAPNEFQPPARYADQARISATIDTPKERAHLLALARNHGITFNELIIRSLHFFMLDPKALDHLLANP